MRIEEAYRKRKHFFNGIDDAIAEWIPAAKENHLFFDIFQIDYWQIDAAIVYSHEIRRLVFICICVREVVVHFYVWKNVI